uniref:Secreted protein n=1 Tax=Trichogramma kaykai TaxID=54128 RepID=A0ABD2XSH3_9HYME
MLVLLFTSYVAFRISPHVAQHIVCYDSATLRERQLTKTVRSRITCRCPSDGHSYIENSEAARSSGEKIGLPLLPYARVLIRANRGGCMLISTITATHDFSQK